MKTFQAFPTGLSHVDLIRYLDDRQYVCESEFDFIDEELERQFAELRLTNSLN
jgi:hypothetical protein